ncbi:PadR family transcriptional regulator [Fimbriimonas ginsengisoli]|uniref:Transcriptional regulator, PadR family n=1 Tax=Fimbriimonas ginsengisoli Gsoil 348 TaxID=661478 RepID=A0A068NLP7_FIMGI|nr:helix-turn-helix transcriptional regulator [Fimbriimonas ginsengisoli]AIE84401.1 Transcriptional regulator, PadR family [Fimbriimonas ginsengisoli Gsoil 348]
MTFREDLEALVLSCLSTGPAHGYELSKRIRSLSQEALSVAEGKLYPALHALEAEGDISAVWVPQGNKPPRKVYELTEVGRKTLRRKQAEWQAFARGVGSVLQNGVTEWKLVK